MATIKSFSDLQQSKKLAKILPIESADMTYYACVKDWKGNPVLPKWNKPVALTKEELALPCSNFQEYEYLSCWSLAALIDILPQFIEFKGDKYYLRFMKEYIEYANDEVSITGRCLHTTGNDNLVDACYEMILKLNELNLL